MLFLFFCFLFSLFSYSPLVDDASLGKMISWKLNQCVAPRYRVDIHPRRWMMDGRHCMYEVYFVCKLS